MSAEHGVTVEVSLKEENIPDLKTQVQITAIVSRIVRSDNPTFNWDKIFSLDSQTLSGRFRGIKEGSKRWIEDFQRSVSSYRIDPLILQGENSHQVQPIRRLSGHQVLLVDGLYIPLLEPSGIRGVVLDSIASGQIDLSDWNEWAKVRIETALKGNLTFLNDHFALGLRLGPEMRNKIYLELPRNVKILRPETLIMKRGSKFRVR